MFRDTFNERITMRLVAGTDTESHIVDVHRAQSSSSTQSHRAGVNERSTAEAAREWVPSTAWPTLTVVTSNKVLAQSVGAAGVGQTLILVWDTFIIGITNEVDRTGALLPVSNDFTLGIDSTGIWFLTQVDTRSLNTTLARLTVLVSRALHLPALHLGVSLQSLRTQTDWPVVADTTLG